MTRAFVALALAVLSSCSFGVFDDTQVPPSAGELDDLVAGVSAAFEHRADVGDEWATPVELRDRGYGDCEDFSIYALYLLHIDYSYDGVFVGGVLWGVPHAWIEVGGMIYDPTFGYAPPNPWDYVPLFRWSYDALMDKIGASP